MKKVIIMSMVLALPVVLNAQPEPDETEVEEEVIDRPGMGPGMGIGINQGMRHKGFKRHIDAQPGGWREIPENAEERVIGVIKKYDPSFADKLLRLKEENPQKYNIAIGISFRFLNMAKRVEDPGLEKDIVRGISLEYEVRELSLQYDKANDAEKNKIKEKIKANLNELFDIRTKGQEVRIKMMEKELARLKAGIEKRKTNKAKIVEHRLDQLTGGIGLSW